MAEVVSENQAVPMKILGIPDEDVPNGTDSEVFAYYHMDVPGIAEQVKKLIARKAH